MCLTRTNAYEIIIYGMSPTVSTPGDDLLPHQRTMPLLDFFDSPER